MKKILLLLLTLYFTTSSIMAQVPDFTKTDCNGVTHHLYDDLAAGNAVVLNFCAGWCAPCRLADPLLGEFYNDMSSNNCKVKTYLMLFETNTPGETTDCNFGISYQNQYNLSVPVITNIGSFYSGITGQFFNKYSSEGIPTFLIIIPNVADPANSEVKKIVGYYENLVQMLKDSVATSGIIPKITGLGSTCSNLPYLTTLTSSFDNGNLWSTGETTKTISVNTSGTYLLTANGCTQKKIIEFNPLPVAGTASISSNSVCPGGIFTIDYNVSQGNTTNAGWIYKKSTDLDWAELAPANAGPINLQVVDNELPGTIWQYKVKVLNGSGMDGYQSSCIGYSNEVEYTVNNTSATIIPGTATISAPQTCLFSNYTVTYTGGIANSIWQIYDDYFATWYDYSAADNGSLQITADDIYFTINGLPSYSTSNGLPGNKFRVKSPNGDCYAISNEVEIGYLSLPQPVISGPNSVCKASNNSITLQLNNTYPEMVWSTGQTATTSIVVNPSLSTTYSVNVTDANGCSNTASKYVVVNLPGFPTITSSSTGTVCTGDAVSLNFGGTNSVTPCTNDVYGQYPETTFSFSACDGITAEAIIADGYAGEYSMVNVEKDKYYYFGASNAYSQHQAYSLTITNADGSVVYASGNDYAIWKASFTGQIRFYTHLPDCVADNTTTIRRYGICNIDPSTYGNFSWLPGGQTTPSITVNPAVTTNYSLTFTDFNGCVVTSSLEVNVADKIWVLDNDNDGYYPGNPVTQCTSPGAGYLIKSNQQSGDCDDNNAALNPATKWYEDRDNDGYSNLYTVSGCLRPKIYYGGFFSFTFTYGKLASELTSLTQDCDDTRANINPGIVWYKDFDNDFFSDGTTQVGCYRPSGYKLASELNSTGGDCDDNNARINPNTRWYPDLDDDGYSNGNYSVQCDQPTGYKLATALRATTGDCNDNDATINPLTIWFKDADNDGYSDGTTLRQCTQPAAYKLAIALTATTGDCNDNDATISPVTVWYKDADGDGYSDGTTLRQCTPPVGYKLAIALTATTGDCNDNDATISPVTVWYKDADGDGYSDGTTLRQCTLPAGYKLAIALTAITGDCNDNDATISPVTVWYKDADGDGYSDGTTLRQCTQPIGYKLATALTATTGDCNDNDRTVWVNQTYYLDFDKDGYGNAAKSISVCASTPPAGYVANKADCNDSDPAISPAAVEVCGNKVDDNCNGFVDETICYPCQNGTNLEVTSVTANSAQLSWTAIANPVQWQLQYKTTNQGTKWVDVLLTGNIRTAKLTGLLSNQNYKWQLRAKCGRTWTNYTNSVDFKTLALETVSTRIAAVTNNTTKITDNMLKLYPNPAKDLFSIYLQLAERISATAIVSIRDFTGKQVYTEKINLLNGKLIKNIKLPIYVTAGMYLVEVIVNGKAFNSKLILIK